MSGFQDQLDEELKKQESEETPISSDDGSVAIPAKEKNKSRTFSFKPFLIGLSILIGFIALLSAWAQLSSSTIMTNVQESLPSKTAIIEVIDSNTLRMGDSQPVISMPDAVEIAPLDAKEPNENMKAIDRNEDEAIQNIIAENTTSIDPPQPEAEVTAIAPKEFVKQPNKPILSIIVTGLGLSNDLTQKAIKDLPENIALAFSPYTPNLELVIDGAKKEGHEIWMMMPSETTDYPLTDMGPLSLLINASVEQNIRRIDTILNKSKDFVGFIPNQDHNFTVEDANINPALHTIFERGLSVFDSKPSAQSFLARIAHKKDYKIGRNNFWLDQNLTPMALNQRIRQMIEFAEANGSVTVMLKSNPASLKALEKFIGSAEFDKFQLAPASSMLKTSS